MVVKDIGFQLTDFGNLFSVKSFWGHLKLYFYNCSILSKYFEFILRKSQSLFIPPI